MSTSEVVRIRVAPERKKRYMAMYEAQGITLSNAVRDFLDEELAHYEDPLMVLDEIAQSATQKTQASGLREPSVDELVAYVNNIRSERAAEMMV